jgi:hypothetical protein
VFWIDKGSVTPPTEVRHSFLLLFDRMSIRWNEALPAALWLKVFSLLGADATPRDWRTIGLVCRGFLSTRRDWFAQWLGMQPADSVFCEWNVDLGPGRWPAKVKDSGLLFLRDHIHCESLRSGDEVQKAKKGTALADARVSLWARIGSHGVVSLSLFKGKASLLPFVSSASISGTERSKGTGFEGCEYCIHLLGTKVHVGSPTFGGNGCVETVLQTSGLVSALVGEYGLNYYRSSDRPVDSQQSSDNCCESCTEWRDECGASNALQDVSWRAQYGDVECSCRLPWNLRGKQLLFVIKWY